MTVIPAKCKSAYQFGNWIIALCALFILASLVAGSVATIANAATIKVGGKNGLKTIAKALAKARAGDSVVIRPGIYSAGFKITREVAIRAEPGAYIRLGPKQTITIKDTSNVTLDGFVVSSTAKPGDKAHFNLLNIIGSTDVIVKNCQITLAGGWGVAIENSRDVTVEKCHISGLGEVGIILQGERLHLRRTTITGPKFGVYIKAAKGVVVANNLIEASSTGIYCESGTTDLIANTINGPGNTGINLRGGDVAVVGNAVRRYKFGIYTWADGAGVIAANTLGQNTANALVVGGPNYRIRGNTLSYNAGNGILVSYKGEGAWPKGQPSEIVQNTISSNQGNGIVVAAGAQASIRQNLLENNYNGVLLGKGIIEASRNTIVLNINNGLRLMAGGQMKLTANIIANNAIGVDIHAAANLVSQGNVFYGHIYASGFQLLDTTFLKQDWLPTLSGDDILMKVMPARDLLTPDDLEIDPGFVKLGSDYRLRPGSNLLARFGANALPGAFPAMDANTNSTKK